MEEKFFKVEQLKAGELIEGYFIKSESEVNKRVRFLQRRSHQKESSAQMGGNNMSDDLSEVKDYERS